VLERALAPVKVRCTAHRASIIHRSIVRGDRSYISLDGSPSLGGQQVMGRALTEYRELTTEQYLATMREPMRRLGIDEPTPTPGLSIRECVLQALPITGHASIDSIEIPHVYITPDSVFSHVLVSFGQADVFLVVVVDNPAKAIHGYYHLNLRDEYGLK
jgi:hypothetical protein